MMKRKLGRIKQIRIRDVFEKEDRDFTPWLSENLDILGEKLNLDIIDGKVFRGRVWRVEDIVG